MESFRAPTAWADLDGVENDDLEAKLRATGSQAVLVNYALIAFWSSFARRGDNLRPQAHNLLEKLNAQKIL